MKRVRDNTKHQTKSIPLTTTEASLTSNIRQQTSIKTFVLLFSLFICNSYIKDNINNKGAWITPG
jgi:hypothetical protein